MLTSRRRRFVLVVVGALVAAASYTQLGLAQRASRVGRGAFELEEATIAQLQRRMESGQETSRSLVEKYLARIDAIDRRGPALRSIIETNPDALAIADRLDAERKTKGARGALHGIPVLIKDNIATNDRMMTTAGSLALVGVKPPKDAFIVERLREAGAVILGKTNLSEWANFRSTHSSSGWSARGGQTKNPYALDRSPSGSSSGSGAAIAASLAAVAIGTETDGSIVSPSSHNSLVGIKPTVGLLSRTGIVPVAHSQDTPGPMARSVADAVALLSALVGQDAADRATSEGPTRNVREYLDALDPDGLKGARIGIVRNGLFGYSPATDQLGEAAIDDIKKQGAIVVDPVIIPTLGRLSGAEFEVLLYEFKADLNTYLESFGPLSPVRSLKDLVAFNLAHHDEELRYFGQEILTMAEEKGPLSSPDYQAALAQNLRLSRTLGIDLVMDELELDALMAPTTGPAWLIDHVNGDPSSGGQSPSRIAAVAGYPHITVPAGYSRGLPIGVSFFGRRWSEPTLIKIAFAYEQATKHRRPPTFRRTADLR